MTVSNSMSTASILSSPAKKGVVALSGNLFFARQRRTNTKAEPQRTRQLWYSLEELYVVQKRIEERLSEIRAEEPSRKKKNKSEYKIWVDKTQDYIDELQEIRDLIIQKKKE